MNNRNLVNLKAPKVGLRHSTQLNPDTCKPLGWHTYTRACVSILVMKVKKLDNEMALLIGLPHYIAENRQETRQMINEIKRRFQARNCPPHGWHI